MECVVLAGGMGTRLRSAVPDLPKCMAPVDGRPFLEYIVENLEAFGFGHIILSLGYKAEAITEWAATRAGAASVECVVENEPLGTGGAVALACRAAREDDVFVLNGDTFFEVDFSEMMAFHQCSGAVATLALRPMRHFDRYGTVTLEDDGCTISAFREKAPCEEGLINGGVYIVNRKALGKMPEKFSLEKDFFEKVVGRKKLSGYVSDGYFLDIGIPEDYSRAQEDFREGRYKRYDTLLLDRDGVIDVELKNDYVKKPSEMKFIPGSLEAIAALRPLFARILVVTNQRGVGKGLMTLDDLAKVHEYMLSEIEKKGGRIDKIYFSTGIDTSDPRRKPNIGMFLEVMEDYPKTDLSRSFMVGDNVTDMEFADKAGLTGIFVSEKFTLADFAAGLLNRKIL